MFKVSILDGWNPLGGFYNQGAVKCCFGLGVLGWVKGLLVWQCGSATGCKIGFLVASWLDNYQSKHCLVPQLEKQ